jgi:hypothetical protein
LTNHCVSGENGKTAKKPAFVRSFVVRAHR